MRHTAALAALLLAWCPPVCAASASDPLTALAPGARTDAVFTLLGDPYKANDGTSGRFRQWLYLGAEGTLVLVVLHGNDVLSINRLMDDGVRSSAAADPFGLHFGDPLDRLKAIRPKYKEIEPHDGFVSVYYPAENGAIWIYTFQNDALIKAGLMFTAVMPHMMEPVAEPLVLPHDGKDPKSAVMLRGYDLAARDEFYRRYLIAGVCPPGTTTAHYLKRADVVMKPDAAFLQGHRVELIGIACGANPTSDSVEARVFDLGIPQP